MSNTMNPISGIAAIAVMGRPLMATHTTAPTIPKPIAVRSGQRNASLPNTFGSRPSPISGLYPNRLLRMSVGLTRAGWSDHQVPP